MDKRLPITALIIGVLLLAGGCEVETSTSFGLDVQDSILAKDVGGTWEPMDGNTFQRGDVVGIVLLNVQGFEEGEDGLNEMELDIKVTGPDGEVVLEKQNMLEEAGHVNLENNVAKTPVGSFTTTPDLEPGQYRMKVTIRDEVGGGSASKSKTFALE